MARTRRGTIFESAADLRKLERAFHGRTPETRLRVLRVIKEHPTATTDEIGTLAECSTRTVERTWHLYTSGGLEAVLAGSRPPEDRPRLTDPSELAALARSIRNGSIRSMQDAREGIRARYGFLISRSELRHLVRFVLGLQPRWIEEPPGGPAAMPSDRKGAKQGLLLPLAAIRFMNALPMTSDTAEWTGAFRAALGSLLPDVDHIVINIRQMRGVAPPSEGEHAIVLTQHVSSKPAEGSNQATGGEEVNGDHESMGGEEVEGGTVAKGSTSAKGVKRARGGAVMTPYRNQTRQSERLLNDFRAQGRPLEIYYPPCSFEYYDGEGSYLGTLFLWRETVHGPISDETIATLDALEPFMIYAIANHLAWRQHHRATDEIFRETIRSISSEAHLTPSEERVAILHLLGYSYDEMAGQLGVSSETVKRHVRAIHSKTGTSGRRELFAKYFTPRADLPDPPDRE